MVLGLTAAGLAEGAAIGTAQSHVLRTADAGIDTQGWRRATTVGAGFAWFVGMGGGALVGAFFSPWLMLLMVSAWAAGLLSMGYVQWRVLRRRAPRSSRWVFVSRRRLLVGVLIPVVALSTVPNGWALAVHVVVGVVAAVAMGMVVGVLTGATLARLLRSAEPSEADFAGPVAAAGRP